MMVGGKVTCTKMSLICEKKRLTDASMLAGDELRGPIMSGRGETEPSCKKVKRKGELFETQRLQKTYPSQTCVCFQRNGRVGLMEVEDLRGEDKEMH